MNLKYLKKISNIFHFLRAVAYKSQPMFGRHGAHKHHDSMAEVSFNFNYSSLFTILIHCYCLYVIDCTR